MQADHSLTSPQVQPGVRPWPHEPAGPPLGPHRPPRVVVQVVHRATPYLRRALSAVVRCTPAQPPSGGVQTFGVSGPPWKKKSCFGPHIKYIATHNHKESHNVLSKFTVLCGLHSQPCWGARGLRAAGRPPLPTATLLPQLGFDYQDFPFSHSLLIPGCPQTRSHYPQLLGPQENSSNSEGTQHCLKTVECPGWAQKGF